MSDLLLPPYILPTAETPSYLDDGTSTFSPSLARGLIQRQSFSEPRLKVTQKFQALRGGDLGAMLGLIGGLKGKLNSFRAAVGYALRGSFPVTELFANNTFAQGTTGWTIAGASASVSDRTIRLTRTANAPTELDLSQNIVPTANIPYVLRGVFPAANGELTAAYLDTGSSSWMNDSGPDSSLGYKKTSLVPDNTGLLRAFLYAQSRVGPVAGGFFEASWASLSRCALVDNGLNYLLYSDQMDNAVWTKAQSSINPNWTTAPDGSVTADQLVDTGSSAVHSASQTFACNAAINDICFFVALAAGSRPYAYIELSELTGSTAVGRYVNLNTGALGSSFISGSPNWSNVRAFSAPLGNGWTGVWLLAKKTNVATSIKVLIASASGDNGATYVGSANGAIYLWRATASFSSVPQQGRQSTSLQILDVNAPQYGNKLNLKGLPVSTNGLLMQGDMFEIGNELKMCTSALNSDAAGLGVVQFAPALVRSPANNDPVIITQPMGKFILSSDPQWSNTYGLYADLDLSFEHIYE